MNVTLCVVVYNEENNIKQFLDYHTKYFDNIIVLDQLSTDRTVEIVKKYNVTLCSDEHRHLAEPSRHIAALKAETDWILFLDADEYATNWLRRNIERLISEDEDGYFLHS